MAYICQGEITVWDRNIINLPNGWGVSCGGRELVLTCSNLLF